MNTVLLSFDLEEFDMPLEYGAAIEFGEQIRVSREGAEIILNNLQRFNIKATFFCTVIFAENAPNIIHRICSEGHELASHGYYHSRFQHEHLLESKLALEKISKRSVSGFRMARMKAVENLEIENAGYSYNSSLNPTYLPGRYNNFFQPRTVFKIKNVFQIPASTVPLVRFPLFWLSFHNLPLWLYKAACSLTMNSDNYLNMYFHPWEFVDITGKRYKLPGYVSRNSGEKMIERFNNLIQWMKNAKYSFGLMKDFVNTPTVSKR